MFHRRPNAINHLPNDTSVSLARLAALEGFSRAMLVSVVPIAALEALGSKETVARVYLIGALLTILVTLNIGTLERLLRRRRVVTLGGLFLMLAAFFLYLANSWLLPLGIGMRSAAASIFSVCLSLYIMDHIGKQELTRNESTRMQYAGMAWLIGPYLGSWMLSQGHTTLPFVTSAVAAMAMLTYFWRLRLGDNQVIARAQSSAANPWRAVVHYSTQKRLRIAYGITLSRSCFWVTLFVYGPIYVIEAGFPTWYAGALLSMISALLFFSPLIKRLADIVGTRQVVVLGLLMTGMSLVALGVIGEAKPIGLLFWVTGSIGGAALDVVGNIPFMRSVRPRERLAMTTVFSTWREGSEILTPLLVTLILLFFPFYVLYVVLAMMHFGSAYSALQLPRRL